MADKGVTRPQPHVLIIYPDQMRWDAMGCGGNPVVKTPHIDRLALEGVQCTQAYTSYPLCCPFRASLMTGKYAHAHGLCANHHPIPLGQAFLAEMFRDHGYQTGYIGKWHLDGGVKHGYVPPGPRRLGFDHFVGFNRGHTYFRSIYYRDSELPYTSRRYEPDFQTDHLLAFLESSLEDPEGRPFFGMIAYGPPHPPLVAPEHYLNLYGPDEVPVRANTPAEGESKARRFLARYFGLMANIDHNVGKILDWLERRGLAENTMVVFLSDHGDMAGEHGRYAKRNYHEASMHVPMLVRYPRRLPAGRQVETLVDPSVDTMPTLLEACGIPVPASVQGSSLLPNLEGALEPVRSAVYYEILKELEGPERFPVPERGVRTLEWLYVRTEAAPQALYDLTDDPLEMRNVVDAPEHRGMIGALEQELEAHMARTGDDWSVEAVFPPPNFQTHEEGDAYGRKLLEMAIVEP